MFGLTKREQRWKAEQQTAELVVRLTEVLANAAVPQKDHNTEWLCDRCNVIHPTQRVGVLQPCPTCGIAMRYTSYDRRKIEAQAKIIDLCEDAMLSNELALVMKALDAIKEHKKL